MNEGEPRELSLDEVDDLSMQAIDQITARHPVREHLDLRRKRRGMHPKGFMEAALGITTQEHGQRVPSIWPMLA